MPICTINLQSVLFVHIPKCGGSSIERLLQRRAGAKPSYLDEGKGTYFNALRRCSPQHMHAAILDQIFVLSRFDLIFAICREPEARVRSEYNMRFSHAGAAQPDINQWYVKARKMRRNNPYLYDNHLRPQVEFVVPGSVLYRLEDGIDRIWQDLSRRLGIEDEPGEAVPHLRPIVKRAHQASSDADQINDATRALILKDYAADVELWQSLPSLSVADSAPMVGN